jgi:hypothetical protein
MATTPYTIESFPGLNLAADPYELGSGGATDLLNTELDQSGRLRTRNGAAEVSGTATTATISYLVSLLGASSTSIVTVGPGDVNRYAPSTGVKTVGGTWTASTVSLPAKFGTSTQAEMLYIASTNSGAGATLRKYDGTTLSTGTGKPWFVQVFPSQNNRLAQAGYYAAADSPTGANGSGSTVFWSDSGAPDTYSANNFDVFEPGDGENITGLVVYQGQLFIFKNTKAFLCWGEDPDEDGNPVFHSRRIELPDPLPRVASPTSYQNVCVGPDGVYYRGTTGLWRGTGGPFSKVPTPVDPIFDGTALAPYAQATAGEQFMGWAGTRFFMIYQRTTSGQNVLVWDAPLNQWTVWDFGSLPDGISTVPILAAAWGSTLWFGSGTEFYKSSAAQTTDAGTPIAWTYTSGRYSPSPGSVVVMLESSVVGSGQVAMSLTTDLYGTLAGPGATLGTAPATSEGWPMTDQEGTWFAHSISGSGQALVSRLTHYIQFTKPAGVR